MKIPFLLLWQQVIKKYQKQKKQSFSNISFMISSVVLLFSVIILAKDSIAKTFPATQDIYYNLGLMNHQKINDNVLLILTSNNQKKSAKIVFTVLRQN